MIFSTEHVPNSEHRTSLNRDLATMRFELVGLVKEYLDSDTWLDFVSDFNARINNSAFNIEMPETEYRVDCTVTLEFSSSRNPRELKEELIEALSNAADDVEDCSYIRCDAELEAV